jgi:hypothetical protein
MLIFGIRTYGDAVSAQTYQKISSTGRLQCNATSWLTLPSSSSATSALAPLADDHDVGVDGIGAMDDHRRWPAVLQQYPLGQP